MTDKKQAKPKSKVKSPGRYSPRDPVAQGAVYPCPNQPGIPVRSALEGTNKDLMREAASLWITPEDIVVDATFGRGVFWRDLPDLPTHKHDLKLDGVDLRDLPYENGTVDVLVLDPPYRPTHGSKSATHGLADAYQVGGQELDTINDIADLYQTGIAEGLRVLSSGGRLFIKCQDLSYGHRLHLFTYDVLRMCTDLGLELLDQFVLVNKGQLKSSKWVNQERARRAHSILWVVGKP